MKKYIKILSITLSILAVSVIFVACKEKKPNLEELTLTNYYMDIEYSENNLNSICKIDYINSSEAMLKEIKLHLYPASFTQNATSEVITELSYDKAYYKGESFASLNINRVKLNNEDVMPTYENPDNDIMVITLKTSLYPTERVVLEIDYSLTLPYINHRFGIGENTTNIANFYPIVCAYNNGWKTESYAPNGDPFNSDIANYYVNLTAPKNFIVATSGEITENLQEDNNYYKIKALAVRDYAFILSEKFKTLSKTKNDITFNYYYVMDNTPEKSLQCMIDSIQTFDKLFYPYPYTTYSCVEADFCYGGMEYPTLTLISNEITEKDDYLNVIVHETAHQWWYNIVGSDAYNEPWLDEALTEFTTLLFYDYNTDYNFNRKDMINSAHQNYVFYQDVYSEVLGNVNSDMRRPICDYPTEPEYSFTVYLKGVLMYDSLYNLIGKNKFIKSLNYYAENNAFKIATEADLISAFEKQSNTDLENFFDCWLSGKVIIH